MRCYQCCQENCGSHSYPCSCYCHNDESYATVTDTKIRIDTSAVSLLTPQVENTTCALHPRYRVKCRPSDNCENCWRLWIKKNP